MTGPRLPRALHASVAATLALVAAPGLALASDPLPPPPPPPAGAEVPPPPPADPQPLPEAPPPPPGVATAPPATAGTATDEAPALRPRRRPRDLPRGDADEGHARVVLDPAPEAAPVETGGRTRWYGWQNLIVDGLVGLVTLGLATGASWPRERDQALVVGLLGYGLGSPLVHLGHGRGGAAAGSLALRVVAPLLGAALGKGLEPALMLGAAAVAVDDALLAREKVPATPVVPRVSTVRDPAGRLVPIVGAAGAF